MSGIEGRLGNNKKNKSLLSAMNVQVEDNGTQEKGTNDNGTNDNGTNDNVVSENTVNNAVPSNTVVEKAVNMPKTDNDNAKEIESEAEQNPSAIPTTDEEKNTDLDVVGVTTQNKTMDVIIGGPILQKATTATYTQNTEAFMADVAEQIAQLNDPQMIQKHLQSVFAGLTTTTASIMATCIPTTRENCLMCPCNSACMRSLARYGTRTTSIRMPEDLHLALRILLEEDPRYEHITMSDLIVTQIQDIAADYIAVARARLDARKKK